MRTCYVNTTIYNKLFGVMQWDNVLALRTCLETGGRIGDVLKLKSCNLKGRTLTYTAEKTGKECRKVISQELANRLRRNEVNGFFFIGRFGTKPRTRQAVWKDVKKACRTMGIRENVAPHSARKTYAVSLLKESGLAKVQEELQHDRMETTMIYAFSDLLNGRSLGNDAAGQAKPDTASTEAQAEAPTINVTVPDEALWKIGDYIVEKIEHLFRLYN